jgi:putative Ca2+/H+ antiporter (TMEM165/GDT1 family)
LFPAKYVHYGEIILFIGFGIKLIYAASQMPHDSCDVEVVKEATEVVEKAEFKLSKKQVATAIYIEAFVLTFIAEWGDRTQIATIALSAANNPVGVTIGAIIGHGICTALAVMGGRMLAGRISERTLTFAGGGLFLLFGVLSLLEKM